MLDRVFIIVQKNLLVTYVRVTQFPIGNECKHYKIQSTNKYKVIHPTLKSTGSCNGKMFLQNFYNISILKNKKMRITMTI